MHTGPVDGINSFNSIASAINAIGANASRNAIIVMPGNYSEAINLIGQTYSIDIIGESRDGAIISGNVVMGSGIYIKNLTIIGNVQFLSTSNAGISNCTVKAFNYNWGVDLDGLSSNISIDNTLVEAYRFGVNLSGLRYPETIILTNLTVRMLPPDYNYWNNSYGMAIGFDDSAAGKTMKISNLQLVGCGDRALVLGNVDLDFDNFSIIAQPGAITGGWNVAMLGGTNSSNIRFKNSRLLSAGSTVSGNLQFFNSTITGYITLSNTTSFVKIGNSIVPGGGLTGNPDGAFKLSNCLNNNYDPIVNGTYDGIGIP